MRNIIRLKENGFCYGVKNAIKISMETIHNPAYPRPIYLLGNLVHNDFVKKYLESSGIIILDGSSRLEMIQKIDTGTVIFSAHGVSNQVVQIAREKKLTIVDATCPYVRKTFEQIENTIHNDYDVIFVGKANHPETESALDISKNVILFETTLNQLSKDITNDKVALCHQTTMSTYDIQTAIEFLSKKFPAIQKLDMICGVTEKRQQAIQNLQDKLNDTDSMLIIVGDKTSNNSTKLFELAKRIKNANAIFVGSISEIDLDKIRTYKTIYLISGTSTPLAITLEIENVLTHLDTIHTQYYNSKLTLEDYVK